MEKTSDFIPISDLHRQYEAWRGEFISAFEAVCEGSDFISGKYVRSFENGFAGLCGTKYALGVSSGTSALILALSAAGIGAGDEVVVPSATFISTATAPLCLGATPVFADCGMDTWQIDPDSVARCITMKTKAIIGVHLYGAPFDSGKIKELADSCGAVMIEDCAQAHGTRINGRHVGSVGAAGCFSFYPAKNLGAFGEGGCVVTDNSRIADAVKSLRTHADCGGGDHDALGFNMRMDGIQAAMLGVKLAHFEKSLGKRLRNAKKYTDEIINPYITKQSILPHGESAYHQYVVTIPDREDFISYMASRSIGCAVHYRLPCHLQKVFESSGLRRGSLPNSEYLCDHCVSIPVFSELTDEETDRIVDACNGYIPA